MLRSKKGQKSRKGRGQSTVEYLILVAGVIAFIIVFLRPNGPFYSSANRAYNQATQGMEGMANRLGSSRCNATGGNCI